MLFTKKETNYIKGIAIILMLMHHLFAFPDRIPHDANIINSLPFIGANVDSYLANFGKICVAIFLFISGYGFAFKNKINFNYSIEKLKKIYFSFWLVFIIFIPIGFIFINNDWSDSTPLKLAKNILGITSNYNGEWWFIRLYVIYVLALPLISRLNYLVLLAIAPLSTLVGYYFESSGGISVILIWLYPFLIGYLSGKETDKLSILIGRVNSTYTTLLCIILTVILFHLFNIFGLILASPLFALAMRNVYRGTTHHKVINNLGSHSMYMWLTHSFFCYYYTPELIYSVKYTPAILILLIFTSYIVSVLLTYIEVMIRDSYTKLKKSLSAVN
ncbi:acyltransferase family protein [Yersinia rohdei]|uniref:acyltransferase family protein n=1 Tax=Yersinia rohdei TaxID=29485 RepID=UPI0025AA6E02|nr:acyltransferase [Yersinia rohdei]MDN0094011.1 acyltransferase [Yersinia rohdei]